MHINIYRAEIRVWVRSRGGWVDLGACHIHSFEPIADRDTATANYRLEGRGGAEPCAVLIAPLAQWRTGSDGARRLVPAGDTPHDAYAALAVARSGRSIALRLAPAAPAAPPGDAGQALAPADSPVDGRVATVADPGEAVAAGAAAVGAGEDERFELGGSCVDGQAGSAGSEWWHGRF